MERASIIVWSAFLAGGLLMSATMLLDAGTQSSSEAPVAPEERPDTRKGRVLSPKTLPKALGMVMDERNLWLNFLRTDPDILHSPLTGRPFEFEEEQVLVLVAHRRRESREFDLCFVRVGDRLPERWDVVEIYENGSDQAEWKRRIAAWIHRSRVSPARMLSPTQIAEAARRRSSKFAGQISQEPHRAQVYPGNSRRHSGYR